jgi:hypothetical protein
MAIDLAKQRENLNRPCFKKIEPAGKGFILKAGF